MKRTIIRLIVAALLLVACGSTPVLAGGPGFPPLCYPGDDGCPKAFSFVHLNGLGDPTFVCPESLGVLYTWVAQGSHRCAIQATRAARKPSACRT